MANIDVLGCVGAIVSAFQTGADFVQSIRDRRGKIRRLRDKNLERSVEEKILKRALLDGAGQFQAASAERVQRLGDDFVRGDAIAVSELKDVMISMQTEVIGALQIGRTVENVSLDLLALHEAVITNKTNALRAMRDLCQRIMAGASTQQQGFTTPVQSPTNVTRFAQRGSLTARSDASRGSLESSGMAGTNSPEAVSIPAPGIPDRSPARMASRLNIADATSPKRSLTKSLKKRSSNWFPQLMLFDASDSMETEKSTTRNEPQQVSGRFERGNRDSLHDFAVESSVAGHKPSTSIASSVGYFIESRRLSCATADSFENPEDFYKDHSTLHKAATSPRTGISDSADTAMALSSSIRAASPFRIASPPPPRCDSPDDVFRAERASEVVAARVSSPLPQVYRHPIFSQSISNGYPIQNIHPAFRNPYIDDTPAEIAPEPDTIWAHLSRPAKLNDYHGFCKGAWDVRSHLEEGMSIALLSTTSGQISSHWKCKQCAFRSKALSSANVLPNTIYFISCGVRYRWTFLAKSHVHAETAQARPEEYSYGCIFCAAQGSETAEYVGLETLMAHIVAKHKTGMMTPEVLEKTRCLVGGAPGKDQDWDINLPQNHRRNLSGKVGEFVVSAVTGLK